MAGSYIHFIEATHFSICIETKNWEYQSLWVTQIYCQKQLFVVQQQQFYHLISFDVPRWICNVIAPVVGFVQYVRCYRLAFRFLWLRVWLKVILKLDDYTILSKIKTYPGACCLDMVEPIRSGCRDAYGM